MKSLSFCVLLSVTYFLTLSTFAQGGNTGALTWNIDNGTLTISGEGKMPDYYYSDYAPWDEYKGLFDICIIEIGVTSIGNFAFYHGYNLTSISIPNSVVSIGGVAFYNCTSLTSITIPEGVVSIGKYAFYNCYNLTSITLPNSLKNIGDEAFYLCTALPSIILPDSLERINNKTFARCESLSSIIIPNSVKSIEAEAFFWCFGLTSISIPNSVTSIGEGAFNDCGLTSISIPNSITEIKKSTFVFCSNLTSISIPNSVTSIGNTAFANCENLASVIIPISVTNIGDGAFNNCKKLTSFTNFNPKPVIISPSVFGLVNTSKCILNVPIGSVSAYKHTEVWKSFKNIGIYLVNINVNNEEYGTAVGGGIFKENEIATIEAIANNYFQFVNWTINGVEVSTNNPYTFKVKDDVELVANFVEINGINTIETLTTNVYPNPTTGEIQVKIHESMINEIKIYDIFGRNLLSHPVYDTTVDIINISHLSAGVYFVKISTNVGEVIKKVVKE